MSGMEIWWIGESGFRLRDLAGDPVVFVDPYLSADPQRLWQSPVNPEDLAQADLVLCTHEHTDHFDQPALLAAAQVPGSRFILVVPEPIVGMALKLGIPAGWIIGAQPEEPLDLSGAHIEPIPACHGVHMADAYSFGREISNDLYRYLGYVIELGGRRAYHAGDTIPYKGQVELLRGLQPDLALLPINGRDFFREQEDLVGNMNPREAAHLAFDTGAALLVPMHWETFPFNRGYPDQLVAYATQNLPSLSVMVLGRGEKCVYA